MSPMSNTPARKRSEEAGVGEREALVEKIVEAIILSAEPTPERATSLAYAIATALEGWRSPAQVEAAKRDAVREYIESKEMPVVRIETKPEWERFATEVRAAVLKEQREAIAAKLESMAEPWGGSAAWLTTGTRVANLAATIARTFTKGAEE